MRSRALRIGLWDLSTWITRLQIVIEQLNMAQTKFEFWEISAPVPVGLTSSRERILEWARARGLPIDEDATTGLRENILDTDFYAHAEGIRQAEELDYFVGFTPAMIAFEERGAAYWNYISSFREHDLLVSLCDFPEFAKRARRPLAVLALYSTIAQLMVAFHDELNFHAEQRGCLFDLNADRKSIVQSVRQLRVDDQCFKKVPDASQGALLAMLRTLRSFV